MKSRFFVTLATLVCCLALFFSSPVFAAANFAYAEGTAQNDGVTVTDYSFNTENIICLYGEGAQTAAEEIAAELQRIDGVFSLNKDSLIKKLNADGVLSRADCNASDFDDVVYLFGRAKELYLKTDGAFNPATYLLTDLWQLSSRFSLEEEEREEKPYDRELYSLPPQKYIDAFLQLLNFDEVQISNDAVVLPQKQVFVDGRPYSMQVDLGGIVKGFAAQRAKQMANAHGITDGYISLGGSSITFLNNPNSSDGKFSVGVLNPDNINTYYAKPSVKNLSMSTSGNYQAGKYFILDGKRYCHIIDSKTGRPVDTGITTVSILCDDAVAADALTTAVMVLGLDAAKEYICGSYFAQNQINAAFVYKKGWLFGSVNEVIANTQKDFFNVTDNNFKFCGYVQDGGFVYNAQNPNLTLFICIAAVAVVVLVVFAVKKGRDKATVDIKKQKYFKLLDLVIYGAVAVCVVGLFLGFVVFRPQVDLNYIEVYCQNDRVYIYDVNKGEGAITDTNYADKISVERVGGKTVVTVTNDSLFNIIEFDGKTAKMTEANCSNTKECVNNFGAITNGNQIIICDVSHIKVIGVGSADMPILNG